VRRASLLGDATRESAPDESHRKSGRAEQQSDRAAGHHALGGLLADELLLVVRVHVAAGERSPDDDPVAPVMLYERDLVGPRDAVDRSRRTRVRLLGAFGVLEHHQREIERGRIHDRRRYGLRSRSRRPNRMTPLALSVTREV